MMQTVRIQHEVLVAAIRDALERAGVTEPIGSIEAEIMAEADLLRSHPRRLQRGVARRSLSVHPVNSSFQLVQEVML